MFHCVNVSQLSYPFIWWWTFRLFPCPNYYKQCCDEQWYTCVSFSSGFLGVYDQQWDCWKLSMFADDMILYIENTKDTIWKLLELINEYGKLQDIKLTQRNPLHSYTLTMRKQKEKLRKQFHSPLQWKE